MKDLQTEITSVFNVDVPQLPIRYRCRQVFGVHQFAQESVIALFEGLISEQDFELVRSSFQKAHKLCAQFQAGYISKQEYYAHAITLFADFISLGDEKPIKNDSPRIHQDSVPGDMHDMHAQPEEKQQKQQLQQSMHKRELQDNSTKIESAKHVQSHGMPKNSQIEKNSQEIKNQQDEQHRNENKTVGRQISQNKAENRKIQQTVTTQNSLSGQYTQIPVKQVEGFDVKNNKQIRKLDPQEQKHKIVVQQSSQNENVSQQSVERKSSEAVSGSSVDLHKNPMSDSQMDIDEYDEFRDEIVGREVGSEQDRENLSPQRQQMDSTPNQAALMKFLSQNSSPRERNINKLRWDHQDSVYGNNHVAKNYMRKVSGVNLEESDSASNPSEPLSPAPSGQRDDYSTLQKVDERGNDAQSVLSTAKKDDGSGGKRPLSPHFIRETMKSPTSSERSISTQFSSISSLSRKPTMVKDFGARKRIENKKSGITGFQLAEDALNLYEEMRLHRTYKWLILELNPVSQQIDVSNAGESDSTFQDLVDALPHYKCCYAVYNQGERSWGLMKIVFVNWCPEGSPVKQRMIYASSKDFLKQFLGNVAVEVQATEPADLEESQIISQLR